MSILPPSPADRIVVVGAGVAGLSLALRLAPRPVTVITTAPLGLGTATGWAQGGIAAAIGPDDAPALHAADTCASGAGLSESDVAARVAAAAPSLIDWLVGLGIAFDRDPDGALALGLEAAHRRRRIVRVRGDATGRGVLDGLVRATMATPSIEVLMATAQILMQDANGTVRGVVCARDGASFRVPGRAVVLATGGVGGLYASTTNPRGATGLGLTLAAGAGAVLRDLEFVQFHPTAIAVGLDPMPLATEALRGEGARLIDGQGQGVMAGIAGGDLAPRDVVARAIFQARARGAEVFLDCRGALGGRMSSRFPTVAGLCARPESILSHNRSRCGQRRITIWAASWWTRPGAAACRASGPAARSLPRGCTAPTGSPATRCSKRSPIRIGSRGRSTAPTRRRPSAWLRRGRRHRNGEDDPALPQVRELMERAVGVLRDADGLSEAVRTLSRLAAERSTAALTGLLIAVPALMRRESRGAHCRADHPGQEPPQHSVTSLAEITAYAAEVAHTELRVHEPLDV